MHQNYDNADTKIVPKLSEWFQNRVHDLCEHCDGDGGVRTFLNHRIGSIGNCSKIVVNFVVSKLRQYPWKHDPMVPGWSTRLVRGLRCGERL